MTCPACFEGICTQRCTLGGTMKKPYNFQAANEARHADMLNRIKPHRESIVQDLHQDELSLESIATKYGLSVYAIEHVAADEAIDLRPRADRVQAFLAKSRFPADEAAILADLRDNQLTAAMIAQRHCVGEQRVRRIARENGIDLRARFNKLPGDVLVAHQSEQRARWIRRGSTSGTSSLSALRMPMAQMARAIGAEG